MASLLMESHFSDSLGTVHCFNRHQSIRYSLCLCKLGGWTPQHLCGVLLRSARII